MNIKQSDLQKILFQESLPGFPICAYAIQGRITKEVQNEMNTIFRNLTILYKYKRKFSRIGLVSAPESILDELYNFLKIYKTEPRILKRERELP